jgi:hypothetical protein
MNCGRSFDDPEDAVALALNAASEFRTRGTFHQIEKGNHAEAAYIHADVSVGMTTQSSGASAARPGAISMRRIDFG